MSRLILLYVILAIHLAGLFFRWYITVPYYDKLAHFLGGFWVAMMAVYLLDRFSGKSFFNHHYFLETIFIVGATMIIGFGWEMYEFLADIFVYHKMIIQAGLIDTMTDLLTDFMGGLVYSLFRIGIKLKNP